MVRYKNKRQSKASGFTPHHFFDKKGKSIAINSSKRDEGFTLIELLVVISIIALLSSVALIALQAARAKARDVKRLGDMTQMNTALELYFATYKGYPSSSMGIPQSLVPYANSIPKAPQPTDGVCDGLMHSAACISDDPDCGPNVPANTYYYSALGTAFLSGPGGVMVYPSYTYYFCLGDKTGNFTAGERILSPVGVR